MGEILDTNLKIYRCQTWTPEGTTHGGLINTGAEITGSTDQLIFDDVTDAERASGATGADATQYRKIFFRNENADSSPFVVWIDTQYPSTKEAISIALGTSAGTQTSEGAGLTYTTPTTQGTGLTFTLANNASQAIWIRRIITASSSGWKDDNFILKFGTA
jgi:hypothetical protein